MRDDTEDRFDGQLRQAAQDYHRPPDTPREEMWAAIAARRRAGEGRPVIVLRPWLRWGLGIAAVLALGIGIGRWTVPDRGRVPQNTFVYGPATSSVAYQVAATDYLSRTETLLTGFRAQRPHAPLDTQVVEGARDLLSTTRLLLESPAGQDPHFKSLLEDLELVLAQIAQLPSGRRSEEVDLINQGLEQRGVLPRLRTAIPAGPTVVRPQGAL